MKKERVQLRLRVGAEQAHYGGGLVDGAFVLKLFGDAATELLIRRDGDECLLEVNIPQLRFHQLKHAPLKGVLESTPVAEWSLLDARDKFQRSMKRIFPIIQTQI